jgi:hypothetical protein
MLPSVSPSAVHQIVVSLEKLGFIQRTPSQARSIRLLLPREAAAGSGVRAIVPVTGDKSGGSEKRLYKRLIAKADKRFTAHCERLDQEEKQRKQQEKERKRKWPWGRR